MKPGINDLSKWSEKTAMAVRRICQNKKMPCIAFSLLFFDIDKTGGSEWNYVIEIGYDPEHPPSVEERTRIQEMMEYINEGVKRIIGADDYEEGTSTIQ